MKVTKKLIERMVREAVKQYAVNTDTPFRPAVGSSGYEKMKSLATVDPKMAYELGYSPEIDPEKPERTFSEPLIEIDPILNWFYELYHDDSVKYRKNNFIPAAYWKLSHINNLLLKKVDSNNKALWNPIYQDLVEELSDLFYRDEFEKDNKTLRQTRTPAEALMKSEMPEIIQKFKNKHPNVYDYLVKKL